MQVENGSKVRAVLPTPQQGQLPVPSSLATTPASTWDDMPLHACVKKEGPPHVHPSSVLDFKVCIVMCIVMHWQHRPSVKYLQGILFDQLAVNCHDAVVP